MQGPHSLAVAPHRHLNIYILPGTKNVKLRGSKGQAMVRERLRCDCDWKGGHWLLANEEKQAGALGL